MIWYDLSKGRIPIPDPDKYSLICTHLSLTEIAFSPNNFHKLEDVQNTIKSVLHVNPYFIKLSPTEHARTIIDPEYDPQYDRDEDLMLAFLRILPNHPKEGLLNNDFKKQLAKISAIRKHNFNEQAEFLNKLYDAPIELKRVLKRYSKNRSYFEDSKRLLLHELNQFYEANYDLENVDWYQFEFYLAVHGHFMRTMDFSRMKADGNDHNDLRNMLYVQPENLYWTKERRWLTLAKEAGMSQYLYEPEPEE